MGTNKSHQLTTQRRIKATLIAKSTTDALPAHRNHINQTELVERWRGNTLYTNDVSLCRDLLQECTHVLHTSSPTGCATENTTGFSPPQAHTRTPYRATIVS